VRFVAAIALVVLVAGCSSGAAPAPATPPVSSTCNLPDRGDVLVRERIPGRPVYAVELTGTDPDHCVWTIDAMKTSVPTGPGFCTEVAWASDNVDYNINIIPAPALKKVQAAIGDCR
jgi:hypothetical protein